MNDAFHVCVCVFSCVWQYKYLAILESAHGFTQMEWLMAHSSPTPRLPFHSHTDACQRPFWRCYINQRSLSISFSLSLFPSSPSSPSRSLFIFHTASSTPRLFLSLSARCRSALSGSANLPHCWIPIKRRGGADDSAARIRGKQPDGEQTQRRAPPAKPPLPCRKRLWLFWVWSSCSISEDKLLLLLELHDIIWLVFFFLQSNITLWGWQGSCVRVGTLIQEPGASWRSCDITNSNTSWSWLPIEHTEAEEVSGSMGQ